MRKFCIKKLFRVVLFIMLLANAVPALAATECGKTFCFNVAIGNMTGFDISPQGNSILGEYIATWYGFLLGTVGIMATLMIMWGGFKYLTSRGDKGMIDSAKNIIISAITGVVLAFGSYTILSVVNPALLKINMPGLTSLQGGESVDLGSYGKAITGEGAATTPNTTVAQATASNTKNIPCTDNNGTLDYSTAYTASYEGFTNTPYWDVNGYSIGYGHHYSSGESAPASITQAQALALLNEDYARAEAAAESTFSNWNSLGNARQAAITDLAYNMGTGVFVKFPRTTAAIASGNFSLAATELLNSDYASQLPQRAANNAAIIGGDNSSANNLYAAQAQPACK